MSTQQWYVVGEYGDSHTRYVTRQHAVQAHLSFLEDGEILTEEDAAHQFPFDVLKDDTN